MNQKYDIIGDIHGYAGPLRELLAKLGYRETGGIFRHPDRKVIFLGDYIDRGPAIREVLQIVRSMTEAGSALAIQGNHEFNALAYHTPNGHGGFLRDNSKEKTHQHQATLDQLANPQPEEWRDWLDWFRTLPLFLDLGGLRAVHAAWNERAIALARSLGPLTPEVLARMVDKKSPHGQMKEILLNGLEIRLPEGNGIPDKEGNDRLEMRTRWWDDFWGKTYREVIFPASDSAPAIPIVLESMPNGHAAYPVDAPPVFMGHYWLPPIEVPVLQGPNLAVLDYSIARPKGMLAAYRWDGETELNANKIVSVTRPDET